MTGRGLRGRRAGRAIIVATVLVLLVFALLLVAQPQTIGVMRRSSVLADVVSFLVIGGGFGGILFGLAWMLLKPETAHDGDVHQAALTAEQK